jgi:hypothetical protein
MSGISKYVRPGDIKGNTVYDIILKAWLGHKLTELPDEQRKMLERWEQADRLLRNGEMVTLVTEDGPVQKHGRFNVSRVVEWLKEKYKVSTRTAYEDVHNAKRFFLSLEGRPEKEYERAVAITFGEALLERCEEKGDLKAAAALFKELNKIKGLHEQSIDAPDYAEFQPPKLVITSDPTELGFEKVENPDEIVKRILGESRQSFLESEAEDAEVVE